MRRTVFSVAFAAGILAAVAAASAQTTPAPVGTPAAADPAATPAPAAAPVNNDDVVSCRYEKVTGSLFSKRICHTQREWHQMSTDSHNLMNDLDSHSSVSGPLGGGRSGG